MSRPQYVEVSAFVQYAASSGVVVTDDEAAIYITRAQNYLDSTYDYKGSRVQYDSAFPRAGLKYFTSLEIPPPIAEATKMIALMLAQGVQLEAGTLASAPVSKEVVATGKVEVSYATNHKSAAVHGAYRIAGVTRLLDEYYLLTSSSLNTLKAVRG